MSRNRILAYYHVAERLLEAWLFEKSNATADRHLAEVQLIRGERP